MVWHITVWLAVSLPCFVSISILSLWSAACHCSTYEAVATDNTHFAVCCQVFVQLNWFSRHFFSQCEECRREYRNHCTQWLKVRRVCISFRRDHNSWVLRTGQQSNNHNSSPQFINTPKCSLIIITICNLWICDDLCAGLSNDCRKQGGVSVCALCCRVFWWWFCLTSWCSAVFPCQCTVSTRLAWILGYGRTKNSVSLYQLCCTTYNGT